MKSDHQIKSAIAVRLNRWRTEHGLTQKQAAKRLQFSIARYEKIEARKRTATLSDLQTIKEVLGYPSIDAIISTDKTSVS